MADIFVVVKVRFLINAHISRTIAMHSERVSEREGKSKKDGNQERKIEIE